MTQEMGNSSIHGDMIRMILPNGGFALYPYKFASDAINEHKYSIFVAKGEIEESSLLIATLDTGARTILLGPFEELVKRLLTIPWEENSIETSDGILFRKIAPSLQALEEMIIGLQGHKK
ncbi:hypothetical protein [Paenibacillus polymyxa]|uniref:hypothetical protein n=1 Tax=Paenibacillus polymyxa TaxID=1406 RepID=UPI00111A6B5E|nr:hypothetical protein [Paenibacillus polymyxa]QDA30260.1 hypothetical protein FGY93_25435 [Paenibacillus polymyxa]